MIFKVTPRSDGFWFFYATQPRITEIFSKKVFDKENEKQTKGQEDDVTQRRMNLANGTKKGICTSTKGQNVDFL